MSDSNTEGNRFVWCDIPVADLDRASAFYAAVLGIAVQRASFGDVPFAVLEHHDGNGGCLVQNAAHISEGGILVYFTVEGRIRDAIAHVGRLGGRVIDPLHSIGTHGFRAIVQDSEGNRIALHSSVDR